MNREPDWEALGQLQFLLMRRITEPLNASLAALGLVHLESAANRPREYWQARATREVLGVLNLTNAWQALVRFKLGELLPRQHIRPIDTQALLDWLTVQLELGNPLHIEENFLLESSQEALQEAMLLLYSAAFTLGPNVHLVVRSLPNGVWFRIRYGHTPGKAAPPTLDALLEQLRGNWRMEDTAFELRTAADFVALSGSKLYFQSSGQFCELIFFVYAAGKRPLEPLSSAEVNAPPSPADLTTPDVLLAPPESAADSEATPQLPFHDPSRTPEDTVLWSLGEDLPWRNDPAAKDE